MSHRDQDVFRTQVSTERGRTRITVAGVLDEEADLSLVEAAGGTHIEIDMGRVRRINSYGVRLWMNAMKRLQSPGVKVSFVNCPANVIDQVNMVHGFLGSAHVASLLAPRLCEDCDEHLEQFVELEALRAAGGVLPEQVCPRCARPMELDDVDHKYQLLLSLLPQP